ncbi:MAG: hypothetical protein IPM27_04855 [Nitrosomonadales bacterium]|nr:hypothetical protein [Nitrosomonadales bacterium]
MTSARYLAVFCILLALLAGLTVVFNRVVDPFWYYRDISIAGFNAVKPKFRRYERHVKPALVQREQPVSLIFGSSYSEIGFDPSHPALRAAGKSFNFALAGASWEMVQCNVQFALQHDTALRQIVLGIHPREMPKKDCAAEIAAMASPDERAFLFSFEALDASLNTLLEQRHEQPSHNADGLYFYTRGKPGTAGRFREHLALHRSCRVGRVSEQPAPPLSGRAPDALDLGGLRELLVLAQQKHIAMKLVVYPRHALSFELEYQCGERQARWDALRQIAALADDMGDAQVEVWDFEGYHALGTVPISDKVDIYWQDPAHFNYEAGNLMLDEMFGLKPPQLGMRLNAGNVDARAEAERQARARYLAAHPEFLQQLQNLLPGH